MNVTSWLVDTVTISRPAGTVSGSGDRAYGSQTTIKARVEHGNISQLDIEGEEDKNVSWFTTDQVVDWDDRIWLPGDDTSGGPRKVMRINIASTKPGIYTLYQVKVG